jgi:hypothetical protein
MKNIIIYKTNRHSNRYFAIVQDEIAIEIDLSTEAIHLNDVKPGTGFFGNLIFEKFEEIKEDNRFYNIVLDKYRYLITKATIKELL